MNRPRLLTRRNLLLTGVAAAGGILLSRWWRELPPTYGNILRMGDNLTYAAHRMLLPGQAMAREYSARQITSFPAVFIHDPAEDKHPMSSAAYCRMQAGAFADWGLDVEGMVAHRRRYSLADLRGFPSRTQITRHTCEEGWSAIAEWTGVQLGRVLEHARIHEDARFVTLHCADGYVDSIDMLDAFHPQTLLAYGMNGRDLTLPHGAPVRLRLERQMGYKSMKYLNKIEVTSELQDGGDDGNIRNGWSWYAGI